MTEYYIAKRAGRRLIQFWKNHKDQMIKEAKAKKERIENEKKAKKKQEEEEFKRRMTKRKKLMAL